MKKTCILLISVLFLSMQMFAQKGKDENGSKNKQDNSPPNNNNDGGSNTDNPCLNTGMQITGILFGAYQSSLLSSSKNPTTTSFEVMLHAGVVMNDEVSNIAFYPRVRLNYGAISGDFRYSYIDQGDIDPVSNFDAILDFNIIAGSSFKMSIGQGILYQLGLEETAIFHESYIGMDIAIMDRAILISPEYRLAYDWDIMRPVNSEAALRAGYRIFDSKNFAVYANAAAGYQYYGSGTSNILAYGGLDIFIQ